MSPGPGARLIDQVAAVCSTKTPSSHQDPTSEHLARIRHQLLKRFRVDRARRAVIALFFTRSAAQGTIPSPTPFLGCATSSKTISVCQTKANPSAARTGKVVLPTNTDLSVLRRSSLGAQHEVQQRKLTKVISGFTARAI